MKKSSNSHLLGVFALSCCSLTWIVGFFGSVYMDDWMNSQPEVTHAFVPTNNAKLFWKREDISIYSEGQSIDLIAADGRLFYLKQPYNSPDTSLWEIDRITGQNIGQIVVMGLPSRYFDNITNVGYSKRTIYLIYGGGKVIKDSTASSGGFMVYDLQQNSIVWSDRLAGLKSPLAFVGSENILVIRNNFAQQFIIDVQKKSIYDPINDTDNSYGQSSLRHETVVWFEQVTHSTVVEDSVWVSNLKDVFQPPIIMDDRLIVRSRPSNRNGFVVAYDQITGHKLWEYEKSVASNVAVIDDTLFLLNASAELVAIDAQSGQESQIATFSGKATVPLGSVFFVAADEMFVYVYLGDSQQLFAIRP